MTHEDLEQIGKLIDERLEPIKKDMATKQGVVRLEQKIDKEAETMANFFQETWARMDGATARITRLEEAADLTHRN